MSITSHPLWRFSRAPAAQSQPSEQSAEGVLCSGTELLRHGSQLLFCAELWSITSRPLWRSSRAPAAQSQPSEQSAEGVLCSATELLRHGSQWFFWALSAQREAQSQCTVLGHT